MTHAPTPRATSSATIPAAIAAEGLALAQAGRTILAGVDFSVRAGEIVGLLGANGAGKSTLLAALAGLLRPAAGLVRLEGRPIAAIDRRALGRTLAYLPQARIVHWPLTARAVVALGRLPHGGGSGARDRTAVDAALAAMDVSGLAERRATELSGGELARVLIARMLAQEARVLLADEPTSGLDPAHQLALLAHLRRLACEGRAILVALHDLSLAARACDRIAVLAGGRLVALGPPGEVLTEATLATAFGIRARIGQFDGFPIVVPVEPVT